MPEINAPVIPQNITVHLGPPESNTENVTVPFVDYIKNVASSEIYPTWPDNALRANIYAIISFALNRIYTEWYRSRGYDFDITNNTAYDQAFVPNRDIFANINTIVDEVFNSYITEQGRIEPLFAQFCNGTTSTCEGLSQWGSVALAEQGLTPYEILQQYYGNNLNIVNNAPVQDIEESYPGEPLSLGDFGNEVSILQNELNRIAENYPAIPRIDANNGVFDIQTQNAVRKFQEIFNLTPNGTVDRATWYKIKQYYVGVKRLAELISEGISAEEATLPFGTSLSEGDSGKNVRAAQYYLNTIAYFNPSIDGVTPDGYYGPDMVRAVRDFQSYYGLEATGNIDRQTWNTLENIYEQSVNSIPEDLLQGKARLYPGYILVEGISGDDVRNLQTYLSALGAVYPELPEIPITGYYGEMTRDAVYTFQRLFGLPETGDVNSLTWYAIAREYDNLNSGTAAQ